MVRIRWTEESVAWLEEIYNYIAADRPNSAKRVVEGIYEKAQLLEDMPEIGYWYRSTPDGVIRVLLHGHYRIAYLIRNEDVVDILGVFHGAMDMGLYL